MINRTADQNSPSCPPEAIDWDQLLLEHTSLLEDLPPAGAAGPELAMTPERRRYIAEVVDAHNAAFLAERARHVCAIRWHHAEIQRHLRELDETP